MVIFKSNKAIEDLVMKNAFTFQYGDIQITGAEKITALSNVIYILIW